MKNAHWVAKQSIYFPHVLPVCTKSQQLVRNGKLQNKTIAVENAYEPIIQTLVKSLTVPLAMSVGDATIVPYTMSVYLLQIQTKAQNPSILKRKSRS